MPDLDATIDKAIDLSQAMRADGKEAWKACLIQITRPGPKLNADFEYDDPARWNITPANLRRSEEHTSELQSLMRISYAVFCMKKKKDYTIHMQTNNTK